MAHLLTHSLRAPEGVWTASSERRPTTNFVVDFVAALSYATVQDEDSEAPAEFLLFNTQQFLYICNPQCLDREPLRIVDFRHLGAGASGPVYPTCHAHTSTARDEFDLAVGLSTGEVMLLSLRAQLRTAPANTRAVSAMSLNVDGCNNASRCVSLAWLPGSEGTAFVAAHRDGAVLLYHKVVGSSSDTKLLARSSSQAALRPPLTQLQGPGGGGGVNAAAVSPDGQHVAVACKDGVLRVYACPGGGLVAGFKSYYGGLLCCCWSPDGRYVAAGGEDDMVAMYGLEERCIVAYCRGHASWVSGVTFDPWMCHVDTASGSQQAAATEGRQQDLATAAAVAAAAAAAGPADASLAPALEADRVYRLASVGHDCQLALWDLVVSEESVAAALQASSANTSPERERPGLPPSPSKRRGRSASPTKRAGSAVATVFRQRSSGGGAADPGALPTAAPTGVIAPPLPRADWPLVTPVLQQRVHPEPVCGVLAAPPALFTACHGSCVRRWERPPMTQAAVVRRIDSLHSLHGEDKK